MGLREIVLLLIVVVAAYVAYQIYCIVRGARAGKAGKAPAPVVKPVVAEPPADAADVDDDEDDAVLVFERPVVRRTDEETRPAGASDPRLFELELELRQLRRELEQQRADAAALRQIVCELGEAVRAQKTQPASAPVHQSGSPQYDEALVYARRGLDVDAIAERCGITVAEAELVRSLARGREGGAGQ
ncbi:DUF2802 domain-containing protein [Azoarcus sp. KH32C]|uniref:DUF2802 domain-containing protein n=1 Tax=Azoarcus sp. KH32C TaxID=748247 RepID=UPI0002386BD0|nr:DUF2802 domain-containing protein [Azoarcus sp. KH32C]BAL26529.1 hypothetical protein AZKH_4250 [Azoarcus sp. KH32C]